MYQFDRTSFNAFKANDHNDYDYWLGKPVEERLRAAYFLISLAYRFDPENPPSMDKTFFQARKRD